MLAYPLVLMVLLAPSHTAGDDGAIVGVAVNGTASGTLLSGAEIVLRVSRDGAFVPLAETTTDAEGRFAFDGLSIEKDTIYLPGVNRAGVHYPGPRLRLEPGRQTAQVKLIAFDAVESPSPLVCRRHEIAVHPGKGFLEISESLLIENPSLTAFVGQQNGDLPPVTLRLSLPEGLDKVTFDREFHGRNFQIVQGRFTTDLPWPPGNRELKFTYRLPVERHQTVLTRVLDQPTDQMLIRVNGKGRIECNLPSVTTERDDNASFANRSAALPAGFQIELQLGAVSVPIEAYGRWIAVAVLVMLVMGSTLAVRNRRSSPSIEKQGVERSRKPDIAVTARGSRRQSVTTSSRQNR